MRLPRTGGLRPRVRQTGGQRSSFPKMNTCPADILFTRQVFKKRAIRDSCSGGEVMKKTLIASVATGLFLIGMSGVASALPEVNLDGDNFEDVGGLAYSFYQNSYDFIGIDDGGNVDAGNPQSPDVLEAFLLTFGIVVEITPAETTYTTEADLASGTWATSGADAGAVLEFYTVKAANAYAAYIGNPADSSGSWSTFDLWLAGYGGNEPLEISHFDGWNPGTAPPPDVIPEPMTMLLFGTGLVGLAGARRKMRNQ